jgi:glycosyltransferase involved in cell wall biosynthesis
MNKTIPRKSKRVAIVLGARHNFWLDQRVQRTARALVSGGYEVLAYTPSESRENERPVNGVVAKYVSVPGANNKLFRKFLLDYLLYNIPAALNMRRNKVHICHCNDFDTLPCGVLLKLISFGRVEIVYDSHEDYPLLVEEGRGKLLGKWIGFAEAVFTRLFVDRAITVNETLKAKFEKRGIKSEAIFNCQELPKDTDIVANLPIGNKDAEFWVAYQGNITKLRGYEQLVEAADVLVNTRKIQRIKFIVIGKSAPDVSYGEHIKGLIDDKALQGYFLFTGFVSYTIMMQMLIRSDVGLILFQPTPNNVGGLPNKLFENLAAGIPTIASNFPEMARIINEEKCGLLVAPTKPQEIADAIEYLYRHDDVTLEMGRNALSAAQEKYNFAVQAEKLLKFYRTM